VPKPTPPVSEYEFVIGFPDKTCTNIPVQIPVDFVTTAVGDMGYDGVRFKIEATGPGDLFFKTTDSNGDLNMFTNTGYWNPENGFNIPADYEQTTYWETEFTVPGTYTIIISMVNAVDDDIIGNISKTITIMANLLPTAPVYDEVLNTHTYDGTVKTAVI